MKAVDCIRLLKDALAKIDDGYYLVKTSYCPSGIVRERVFCYELYHQLRSLLDTGSSLFVHGEIDKSGNPNFQKHHRKNPDFVFHVPVGMSQNTLVVEVKGKIQGRKDAIEKDLEKLLTFVRGYQYDAGAFLLYNHSRLEFINGMGDRINRFVASEDARLITLLFQKDASSTCEEILLSKLFKTVSLFN